MVSLRPESLRVRFDLKPVFRREPHRAARRVLAVVSLVALTFGGVACVNDEAGFDDTAFRDLANDVVDLERRVETLEGAEGAVGEPFDENAFFNDPLGFIGQQVTVRGLITQVISSAAFQMTREGAGGTPILVVSSGQPGAAVGQLVRVTGDVREFGVEAFGRELNAEFDETVFREFEGDPTIVARSVTQVAPGTGQSPAPGQSPSPSPSPTTTRS